MKDLILTISFLALVSAAAPALANDPETVEPERTLGVVYGDERATEDVPLYRLAEPSEEQSADSFS